MPETCIWVQCFSWTMTQFFVLIYIWLWKKHRCMLSLFILRNFSDKRVGKIVRWIWSIDMALYSLHLDVQSFVPKEELTDPQSKYNLMNLTELQGMFGLQVTCIIYKKPTTFNHRQAFICFCSLLWGIPMLILCVVEKKMVAWHLETTIADVGGVPCTLLLLMSSVTGSGFSSYIKCYIGRWLAI